MLNHNKLQVNDHKQRRLFAEWALKQLATDLIVNSFSVMTPIAIAKTCGLKSTALNATNRFRKIPFFLKNALKKNY